jgi:hypothetical protein
MVNRHITTSQTLLKELEQEMNTLYNLLTQGKVIASNLEQTWTALSVTHGNFQRDVTKENKG